MSQREVRRGQDGQDVIRRQNQNPREDIEPELGDASRVHVTHRRFGRLAQAGMAPGSK
jgi:hypothetical protein